MDKRVLALRTPDQCMGFVKNAIRLGHPNLAQEARQRAVELRALEYDTLEDAAEREAIEAVFAYESVLTHKRGKKVRATKTWQLIKQHGILPAFERAVNRSSDANDHAGLLELGLERFAFELVVLRHPDRFTAECVGRSKERVASWEKEAAVSESAA
jgi:hypothetical protein